MATLLQLPVELRLKIYSMAISSRPNVINIDEGASSSEPPRSTLAKSLAAVDQELSREMMPLYWSTNIFETYLLNGMGHYIPTDWTFHRWLKDIVKDSATCIRHLRFKGMLRIPLDHEQDCIFTVDVDLRRRKTWIWDKTGRPCDCEHAVILRSRMAERLSQVPRVDGQWQPSPSILWDVFDCWYAYHPVLSRPARSWDEFQRQYGHFGP